jgi:hypothetical protein
MMTNHSASKASLQKSKTSRGSYLDLELFIMWNILILSRDPVPLNDDNYSVLWSPAIIFFKIKRIEFQWCRAAKPNLTFLQLPMI